MGTRETLVDVATELLDSGGVDAVTLREVGHRSGVSHTAPYRHFADKEALLAAVATRELAALAEALRRARDDEPTAREALRQSMHRYVTWAQDHPARFALVFGPWTAGSVDLDHQAARTWTQFVLTVAAAQEAGELPAGDPERLAALLRATAHGAVSLALTGHLGVQGKGRTDAAGVVGDLFDQVSAAPTESAGG